MAPSFSRPIVVPGELLDESGSLSPGPHTYRVGPRIFATRLGLREVQGNQVSVIPLSGRYEPRKGDFVIGTVVEAGPSNWYVNVGGALDVGIHVNDVPWKVEFGETTKFLAPGDLVYFEITHVDDLKRATGSMKDRSSRKLVGGAVVEISPVKVPRVIGKGGSMIRMIKDLTGVRILVGQNGIVWIEGEDSSIRIAREALERIESEAHTGGLTERIRELLEKATGKSYSSLTPPPRPSRFSSKNREVE